MQSRIISHMFSHQISMSTYLGQNFLKDSKVISYITTTVEKLLLAHGCDTIIEIWPWKWAITKKIAHMAKNFFVVEKDPKMITYINSLSKSLELKINIIHQDILETDILETLVSQWIDPKKTLVIWNLPYYITSPIVRKFFGWSTSQYWAWFFMMQKEVWEKIKTDAAKKSFLRWMSHFANDVKYSKTIQPKAFNPAPNVHSCLMTFIPKTHPELNPDQYENFVHLLDSISSYKRKTLWKIWKMLTKNNKNPSYILPDHLASKRLEETTRDDMREILL